MHRPRPHFTLLGAIFLALLPTDRAYAGAWTQEQGKGLAVSSTSYYSTSEYFDTNGDTQPQSTFNKQELNLYGEYGFRDDMTLGLNLFLNHVEQDGITNTGLSNTELFLRQRIFRDDARVISLQPLIKLPSLDAEDRTPRGGSKSADGALYLLYGENLRLISDRDYMDLALGIRARSDGLAPQWHLDAKLGLRVLEQLTLTPALYHTESISPDTRQVFAESGDRDYSLTKAELSAAYMLGDGRYVQLAFFAHIAGKQTGSGNGITVSYGVTF